MIGYCERACGLPVMTCGEADVCAVLSALLLLFLYLWFFFVIFC